MRSLVFLSILVAVLSGSCGNTDASLKKGGPPLKPTTVRWLDSAKNFGKINEGQKLSVSFRFRNTGANPLVIEYVRPGCGCTVADFPKEPIPPGGENQITGEFDSHGREGLQHKVIYVKANTPGNLEQEVSFDVEVVKPHETATENK